MALLVLRSTPEDLGLTPDGDTEATARVVGRSQVSGLLGALYITPLPKTSPTAPSTSARASPMEGCAPCARVDCAVCCEEVDPAQAPKIHGAKTANIVLSRRTLPAWIQTPRSAVVPFGVFEKVLSHPDSKQLAAACCHTNTHKHTLTHSHTPVSVID